MVNDGLTLSTLEAQADHDEGPFGDHLRRIVVSLSQDADLSEVVRGLLHNAFIEAVFPGFESDAGRAAKLKPAPAVR